MFAFRLFSGRRSFVWTRFLIINAGISGAQSFTKQLRWRENLRALVATETFDSANQPKRNRCFEVRTKRSQLGAFVSIASFVTGAVVAYLPSTRGGGCY